MKTIDNVLTTIKCALPNVAGTGYRQKHGMVLYQYAMFQTNGDEKYLAGVEVELKQLIDQMLLDNPVQPYVLSFPVIADLYRAGLVSPDLHCCIRKLDAYLHTKALAPPGGNPLSFTTGMLGIVHYFLRRLPDAGVAKDLRQILPSLIQLVRLQFATPHAWPVIGLGITDGMAGVLLLLIEACRQGLCEDEIRQLIRRLLQQLISYRLDLDFANNRYSIFPESVDTRSGEGHFSNALAWSRGDLNQALLFYRAGQLFDDPHLGQMGNLTGLNTLLRRNPAATGITGSDFFAGSAGLAQTYYFLLEVSRCEAYREGYDYWINKTVEFLAQELPAGRYSGRESDPLHGLAGVALVLLSYGRSLSWSRCLLL